MDAMNRNLLPPSSVSRPNPPSAEPARRAGPSATTNPADGQPMELFLPSETDELVNLPFLLPAGSTAWTDAAQLSGTTWSWLKKVYPECEDNDTEAETCLYSALSELAPPAFEHSNRVGHLANRFAQFLGMSQPEQRDLTRALHHKESGMVGLQLELWSDEERAQAAEVISMGGAFHDIGKIAVSRDILNKPGPLTPDERALINLHPVIGEALLRNIPSARDLLPAVRNHHERWDGTGYPDGLAGEAIPWQARIIAIVDSFDAMTEERPYRKAMTEEEACAVILKDKGTHFDPQLADRFAQMCAPPANPSEPSEAGEADPQS